MEPEVHGPVGVLRRVTTHTALKLYTVVLRSTSSRNNNRQEKFLKTLENANHWLLATVATVHRGKRLPVVRIAPTLHVSSHRIRTNVWRWRQESLKVGHGNAAVSCNMQEFFSTFILAQYLCETCTQQKTERRTQEIPRANHTHTYTIILQFLLVVTSFWVSQ